jgi:hypothetical protein
MEDWSSLEERVEGLTGWRVGGLEGWRVQG